MLRERGVREDALSEGEKVNAVPARAERRTEPRYVTVTALHYVSGACLPQVVKTGKGSFLIEDVRERKAIADRERYCGAQERFVVVIRNRQRYLYRDGNRWFMIPEKDDGLIFGTHTELFYGMEG